MQSQPCLFPRVSKDLGAELSRHTGFRRSFSGSEAEESTSTENLTHEEKYVLRNSTRQDPQGEETLLSDQDKSPDQSFNTLIVHQDPEPMMGSNKPQQRTDSSSSMYYVDAEPPSGTSSENGYYQHQYHHHPYAASYRYEHPAQEITEIPKHYLDQSEVLKHLAKEVQGPYIVPKSPGMLASPPGEQHHHLYHYHHHHHHHLQQQQQRQMLLQQQMPQEQTHPPPDYPKWHAVDGGRMSLEANVEDDRKVNTEEKTEKLSISRSQPDLRHLGIGRCWDECGIYTSQRPKTRGRASSSESGNERGANRTLHMLELLAEENQALKAELAMYHRKVSRLRKFELEIQKVHQSHEELVQSSEKRERLQHAIRVKLEMEIAKLRDLNRILKSQLDAATKRQSQGIDGSDLWKELSRRDAFASQLLQQNKELMAAKERHEIELAAQRATLHEQRTHIDVLDKALSNAQASAVRMEEECQKKQVQVDKVGQLQASLTSLQLVSDRREQVETKLKNQLEGEIRELRRELQVSRDVGGGRRSGGEERDMGCLLPDSGVTVMELKKLTREKDERIVTLEAEVSKWEQRYLEESALRQIAINAASMPKDAKIAALERTSQESEKLIAQARLEKLKQMDELHATNKKCADLEARIKDLESNVAERDVTIKVLRKHSREKDVVYQNAMLRSPRHVPHRSIATTEERPSVSKEVSRPGICPPTLTRSLSGPTLNGEACVEDDIGTSNLGLCSVSRSVVGGSTMTLPAKKKSFEESKNSLDEQLKQLDSQLLSKDSIIQALRAEKEKFPNHYWRV